MPGWSQKSISGPEKGFSKALRGSRSPKAMYTHVILNGAQRSEESRQLKGEILRGAQNDK